MATIAGVAYEQLLLLPAKYTMYVAAITWFLGARQCMSDNVRLWVLPIVQYLWQQSLPLALAVRYAPAALPASLAAPYVAEVAPLLNEMLAWYFGAQVKVNLKYGRYNLLHH